MNYVERLENIVGDEYGKKSFNLSKLIKHGFRVPLGFCLNTPAYNLFLYNNNLLEKTSDSLDKITSNIEKMKFEELEMPDEIMTEINKLICTSKKYAVRSSTKLEDGQKHSFAGLFDSFLNISSTNLDKYIKKCWLSLFNKRAITYMKSKSIKFSLGMGVIIQEMVNADFSGIAFTKNPVSNNDDIVIEAAKGLGDRIVSGQITPNTYILNREGEIQYQNILYSDIDINLIKSIMLDAIKIEKAFQKPVDIEFAVKDSEIFILQTRDITI